METASQIKYEFEDKTLTEIHCTKSENKTVSIQIQEKKISFFEIQNKTNIISSLKHSELSDKSISKVIIDFSDYSDYSNSINTLEEKNKSDIRNITFTKKQRRLLEKLFSNRNINKISLILKHHKNRYLIFNSYYLVLIINLINKSSSIVDIELTIKMVKQDNEYINSLINKYNDFNKETCLKILFQSISSRLSTINFYDFVINKKDLNEVFVNFCQLRNVLFNYTTLSSKINDVNNDDNLNNIDINVSINNDNNISMINQQNKELVNREINNIISFVELIVKNKSLKLDNLDVTIAEDIIEEYNNNNKRKEGDHCSIFFNNLNFPILIEKTNKEIKNISLNNTDEASLLSLLKHNKKLNTEIISVSPFKNNFSNKILEELFYLANTDHKKDRNIESGFSLKYLNIKNASQLFNFIGYEEYENYNYNKLPILQVEKTVIKQVEAILLSTENKKLLNFLENSIIKADFPRLDENREIFILLDLIKGEYNELYAYISLLLNSIYQNNNNCSDVNEPTMIRIGLLIKDDTNLNLLLNIIAEVSNNHYNKLDSTLLNMNLSCYFIQDLNKNNEKEKYNLLNVVYSKLIESLVANLNIRFKVLEIYDSNIASIANTISSCNVSIDNLELHVNPYYCDTYLKYEFKSNNNINNFNTFIQSLNIIPLLKGSVVKALIYLYKNKDFSVFNKFLLNREEVNCYKVNSYLSSNNNNFNNNDEFIDRINLSKSNFKAFYSKINTTSYFCLCEFIFKEDATYSNDLSLYLEMKNNRYKNITDETSNRCINMDKKNTIKDDNENKGYLFLNNPIEINYINIYSQKEAYFLKEINNKLMKIKELSYKRSVSLIDRLNLIGFGSFNYLKDSLVRIIELFLFWKERNDYFSILVFLSSEFLYLKKYISRVLKKHDICIGCCDLNAL